MKRHHMQTGVGHYGVFSGRRWEGQIYPLVRNMILAMRLSGSSCAYRVALVGGDRRHVDDVGVLGRRTSRSAPNATGRRASAR